MSGDPSQVVQFLAQNDAACPSCGYSLRGCAQPCCPECGDELSLSLRGESSNLLVKAMRYLLWAIGTRSIAMTAWGTWTIILYSQNGMGNVLGSGWQIRMGFSWACELTFAVLCCFGLRHLKTIRRTGNFRGIVTLFAWIAVLEVVKVVLEIVISLAI